MQQLLKPTHSENKWVPGGCGMGLDDFTRHYNVIYIK